MNKGKNMTLQIEKPYYGVNYNIQKNNSSFNRGNVNYFPKTQGCDKYTPKHSDKKKDYSWLKTAGLVALTAVGVYKGKNVIGKAIGGISNASKKCIDGAKVKFPNLSQACHSFKEACKTPLKPFIAIGNLFKKKS